MAEPSSLALIPAYHGERLDGVMDERDRQLTELNDRNFDPVTGEFGGHIVQLDADVREVLLSAMDGVARVSVDTIEFVLDYAKRADRKLFNNVYGVDPAQGVQMIEQDASSPAARRALRAGYNPYVFSRTLELPYPWLGVNTLKRLISPEGQRGFLGAYDPHVDAHAQVAETLADGKGYLEDLATEPAQPVLLRTYDLTILNRSTQRSPYDARHDMKTYGTPEGQVWLLECSDKAVGATALFGARQSSDPLVGLDFLEDHGSPELQARAWNEIVEVISARCMRSAEADYILTQKLDAEISERLLPFWLPTKASKELRAHRQAVETRIDTAHRTMSALIERAVSHKTPE